MHGLKFLLLLMMLPYCTVLASVKHMQWAHHQAELLRTQRVYVNVDRHSGDELDTSNIMNGVWFEQFKGHIDKPFLAHYGMYISHRRFLNQTFLESLLRRAQRVGIDTMIVDLYDFSEKYARSVDLLQKYHMHFIPKIDVFPQGGAPHQVEDDAFWQAYWSNIQQAIDHGASAIQLDYIRYHINNPTDQANSKRIYQIVQWFHHRLELQHMPLQIAVFGITSYRPDHGIGQDLNLLATEVDALCPMVYPSHFQPYNEASRKPYQTILSALNALVRQFPDAHHPYVYPYIEMFNTRYEMSETERQDYIHDQIIATQHARAHGWYAWSSTNYYDRLFKLLGQSPWLSGFVDGA